jgi:hypothetical protein
LYAKWLRLLAYQESDDLPGFHYAAELKALMSHTGLMRRTRRLAQEHADLANSLPCNLESSVFVCGHADRMDAMQVPRWCAVCSRVRRVCRVCSSAVGCAVVQ